VRWTSFNGLYLDKLGKFPPHQLALWISLEGRHHEKILRGAAGIAALGKALKILRRGRSLFDKLDPPPQVSDRGLATVSQGLPPPLPPGAF